jgi:hypothetical protein
MIPACRENPAGTELGVFNMRKVVLSLAMLVAAGFSSTPSSAATDEEIYNLNKNTHMLMRAAWSPAAVAPAAAPAKAGKKGKKK